MNVKNLKLEELILGENQARVDHPGAEIEELAMSIKTRGLLQPIRVVKAKSPNENKYEIVMGQRRFLAFKHLGLKEIPAIIGESKEDSIEYLIDSVTENIARKDTSYEENKAVCVKLWRRFGSVKSIVEMTGLSENFVRKHIKWATLNPELRQMVDDGIVNLDAATKATEVAALDEDNASPEVINALAKSMNKLTQSQRIEVKKKKKSNTAVTTGEIIKKVETAKQTPGILIDLTAASYENLKQHAKEKDKTEAEAASEIVEDAMQQNSNESDKFGDEDDK